MNNWKTDGPSVDVVNESAATTLNHYAGLFPTDLDDVAVRLDAAARGAVGDQ